MLFWVSTVNLFIFFKEKLYEFEKKWNRDKDEEKRRKKERFEKKLKMMAERDKRRLVTFRCTVN